MESIEQKFEDIRRDYFKNIFNKEFINDSYQFLESVHFFSQQNGKANSKNTSKSTSYIEQLSEKYKHEIIFQEIQEVYFKINKLKKKSNLLQALITAPMMNSKAASNDKPSVKNNENKYLQLIDKIVLDKIDKEKLQKELDDKCNQAIKIYEREELYDFLKIVNEDIQVKTQILEKKSGFFQNLLKFEEELVKYFTNEVNDTEGFHNITNKYFSLSAKIFNDRTVTLKLEKELDVDIVSLISLIYEVGIYPKWFPFLKTSETLNQPGKAKKVVHMICNLPIISNRDFLIYGFGINRLRENGTVLILCQSIEESSGIFQEEFRRKVSSKYVRGRIKIFGFEIKIISVNKLIVRGLMNCDPKINFIPQKLVNMISEKFASDLFSKFVKIANKYEGSIYQNKNPSLIDKEFYIFINDEAQIFLRGFSSK